MNTLAQVVDIIGSNVKLLRTLRGYSQVELAEAAQVTREYIWALESKRHDHEPKLQTLCRVADTLGVAFHQLVRPIEVPRDDTPTKLY